MENVFAYIEGPVTRRPGTRYIGGIGGSENIVITGTETDFSSYKLTYINENGTIWGIPLNYEDYTTLTLDANGDANNIGIFGAVADLIDYKQGASSADFTPNGYMYRTDANLSADFPLKNGDANKKISVCCWFRMENPPSATPRDLFAKYHSGDDTRSILAQVYNLSGTTHYVRVYVGHSGGTSGQNKVLTHDLDGSVWYHLAVTYDDATKNLVIRLYDTDDSTVYSDSWTMTNNINVEDAEWTIGNKGDHTEPFDGLIDEMVVFNDVLSSSEIDGIRAGTYDILADANCKALWNFENGELETDSVSTNTLTGKGVTVVGLPCAGHPFSAGNVVRITGATSGAVNYNSTQTLTSGTTANELQFVHTFKAETFNGDEAVVKYITHTPSAGRMVQDSTGNLYVGTNISSSQCVIKYDVNQTPDVTFINPTTPFNGNACTGLAITDDSLYLYVYTNGARLWKFDLSDGSEVWSVKTWETIITSGFNIAVDSDDNCYVIRRQGMLVLDRKDGESIIIENDDYTIEVMLKKDDKGRTKLCIDAPDEFDIFRKELLEE